MTSIHEWLAELGLERYAELFECNDIDLAVIADLTDADLEKLGVSMGHRKRLLKAIAALVDVNVQADDLARRASAAMASHGERRQLTVMFCDLVGSFAVSEKLDPEELRALLHDYRIRCGEVINRYEGFVARYVGDGILTYFGWPKAHEEDAERALRAALEIV